VKIVARGAARIALAANRREKASATWRANRRRAYSGLAAKMRRRRVKNSNETRTRRGKKTAALKPRRHIAGAIAARAHGGKRTRVISGVSNQASARNGSEKRETRGGAALAQQKPSKKSVKRKSK